MDKIAKNAADIQQLMEEVTSELPLGYKKLFKKLSDLLAAYEQDRQSRNKYIAELEVMLKRYSDFVKNQAIAKSPIVVGSGNPKEPQ